MLYEYLLGIWHLNSKIGTRVLVKITLMYLSSGSDTKKAVEFDWNDYFFRDTNISTLIQCVYHCHLKSCKLLKVGTKCRNQA